MLLKLQRTATSVACIIPLFLGSPVFSNIVYIDGERINFVGEIISIGDDGSFTLDTTNYTLRLYQAKFRGDYDVQQLVGQRVACRSKYSLDELRKLGFSLNILAANCQFIGPDHAGDVLDQLIDEGAAVRICDDQGNYTFGCPHLEQK